LVLVLRAETKMRARTLQLLYAWEVRGKPPIQDVARDIAGWRGRMVVGLDAAEVRAAAIASIVHSLDEMISEAADNWRMDRIGIVERNILRLALHEMDEAEVPPRVTISEAVRLANWFAGSQAPLFVNGVLDALARERGML